MINNILFEFSTVEKIIFGTNQSQRLGKVVRDFGESALLITGKMPDRHQLLLDDLQKNNIKFTTFPIDNEPTIDMVMEGTKFARQYNPQVMIALGGGSILDAGKAIAGMMTNPGDPLDYLEVIGKGKAIQNQATPLIAIPTTSGTGAEVTQNAVLLSPEHKTKVSLRSALLLPTIALLDPSLTISMPPAVTASSGLDALTQLIEAFTCNTPNAMIDALCQEGILLVARSLPIAFSDGSNQQAREEMALASMYSGLALANSRLGAVHGIAGPFGGIFHAPHGAVCARLLPVVTKTNVQQLRENDTDHTTLKKYKQVAQLLTGNDKATIEEGISWLEEIVKDFDIPTLKHYGLTPDKYEELIEKALKSSSMKGNPVSLSPQVLENILGIAIQ